MKIIRPLLVPASLIAAVLLTSGCTPRENASCDHEGNYYTHTENGKRISLACKVTGRNPDGSDKLRWVKQS